MQKRESEGTRTVELYNWRSGQGPFHPVYHSCVARAHMHMGTRTRQDEGYASPFPLRLHKRAKDSPVVR